jgi:hypothetical protein
MSPVKNPKSFFEIFEFTKGWETNGWSIAEAACADCMVCGTKDAGHNRIVAETTTPSFERELLFLYLPPLWRRMNTIKAATRMMPICTLGFMNTVRRRRWSGSLLRRRVYEYRLDMGSPGKNLDVYVNWIVSL